MKEIWKDIDGYDGRYQVSNLGQVRSKTIELLHSTGFYHTWPGGMMRQNYKVNGYKYITLCKKHKYTKYYIHRLVGQYFLGPPKEGQQINHKDNNRDNNVVTNLEWCSVTENTAYKVKQGRQSKGKRSNGILSEKDILDIRKSPLHPREIGLQYGISREHAARIKARKTWAWLD